MEHSSANDWKLRVAVMEQYLSNAIGYVADDDAKKCRIKVNDFNVMMTNLYEKWIPTTENKVNKDCVCLLRNPPLGNPDLFAPNHGIIGVDIKEEI